MKSLLKIYLFNNVYLDDETLIDICDSNQNIQLLDVSMTSISPKSLKYISEKTNLPNTLLHLNLDFMNFETTDIIQYLIKFKNLKFLSLQENFIDDDFLISLQDFQKLEFLDISFSESYFDQKYLKKLKESNPNLIIKH